MIVEENAGPGACGTHIMNQSLLINTGRGLFGSLVAHDQYDCINIESEPNLHAETL